MSAALDEFSAAGFAATRLDDVARRAGVAKGTIYLYFADKETLFQELARSMMSPLVGNIEGFAAADIPLPMLLEGLADVFVREIIGTRRKDVIRLILSEGPRFPALAEFYHREVLSRVIAALRIVLQRAYDRGELRHKSLIEFPQLLAAPGLVAILWNAMFEPHRAARCTRDAESPSRHYSGPRERGMIMQRIALACCLAAGLSTGGCSKGSDDIYQGWIEGDFIFVSPDEQGRIETMMVRQGDQVKTGQLMFTLDQDLQAADLGVAEATLANAKQAFDRAQQLMKSGSGTQKDFDVSQALYREAQARLAAAKTRLTRRKVAQPGRRAHSDRSISGPAKPCRRAARSSRSCRPAMSRCASSCRSRCWRGSQSTIRSALAATAARPISPERSASFRAMPNTRRRSSTRSRSATSWSIWWRRSRPIPRLCASVSRSM